MGGGASKNALSDKQVQRYVKELGYSPSELDFLFNRFRYLCKAGDGELSKQDLGANPHLSGNKYVSRLYNVLPKNGHGCVTFDSFVRAAAVFRAEKSLDGKLDFIFDLFDYNMDDTLDPGELKEMIQLAKPDLSEGEIDELVSSTITDILAKSANPRKDGRVHRQDFVDYGRQLPGIDKLLSLNLTQHLS